ncbi:hypothetical protein RRG08_066084 [Elysia crispata]|uniref:Uncharacterized protein n=1 Tax=Elysia crispata TaxID=231223 RepID=A0AAE0YE11_9GAST|nr:hypothetical protein RRG08_066084 [Elysia crispata]
MRGLDRPRVLPVEQFKNPRCNLGSNNGALSHSGFLLDSLLQNLPPHRHDESLTLISGCPPRHRDESSSSLSKLIKDLSLSCLTIFDGGRTIQRTGSNEILNYLMRSSCLTIFDGGRTIKGPGILHSKLSDEIIVSDYL